MAESRRPRSDKSRSDKSRSDKPRSDKPRSDKPSPRSNDRGNSNDRRRSDRTGTDRRSGTKNERGDRGDNYRGQASGSDRRDGGRRRNDDAERTADQKIYDGPPIPDDVAAKDLDKHALRMLHGLPEKLVDRIARHLVMAGLLLHEDPETAHKHALAARARATRNPMVREACGETAYAAENFSEALSEFRAAKRMNGQYYYVPMMADCERALGRPEKAIKMDIAENRNKLDDDGQIELSIVVAGARRDLGEFEAALRLLETEPLHTQARADWVPRLRYAYADSLLAAGRTADAIEWFHRTVAVDGDKATDAAERVAALTNDLPTD